MYKIRDFDSEVDYFRTTRGMFTNGDLIAYCKLPELEPEKSEEENIELTESEHDDIMFGRYI